MKLAILVRYIGTSFDGFQAQPSGNTVQQHLTRAVSELFGFPCCVTGCSRTDSGVHANGFVASVFPRDPEMLSDNWCTVPPEKFHRAAAPFLHPDIAVIGAAAVSDSFHPRYDASGKEYVYLMKDSPEGDPFLRGRVWQLRRRMGERELEEMRRVCGSFVGKHDFRAFMSKGSSVSETHRDVFFSKVERVGGLIKFTVAADGFLYNMVRIMAGTLAGAAFGEDVDVAGALESGRRDRLGITAPPEGLYLNRVFYEDTLYFKCE